MYSIQSIIYGVPITEAVSNYFMTRNDPEEYGFTTLYHGGASGFVGFCGVQLGEDLDECGNFTRIDQKTIIQYNVEGKQQIALLNPTDEQKLEAQKKVDALSEELRSLCPAIGTYLIYSTS